MQNVHNYDTDNVRPPESIELTPDRIASFLEKRRSSGSSEESLVCYRRHLYQLCESLSDDMRVTADSLRNLRDSMLEQGYSPSTINLTISVCNSWLAFEGRRDLQMMGHLDAETHRQPELTRGEYLKLLTAARAQKDERRYLLTKLFVLTGIPARDLPCVTVTSVRENTLRMPDFFVAELLSYALRECIDSGPVFLSRRGSVLSNAEISSILRRGCAETGIERSRITPASLRNLHDSTRDSIRGDLEFLVKRNMDRRLEAEEVLYGWSALSA